ncbi:unnamed protein product [Eretmochelys imbricata]
MQEREVRETALSLKTGTSPDSDGLPPELYWELLELLMPGLTNVFNSSLHHGALSPSQYDTILVLLTKLGVLTDIRNWRPIALLNTDYKILGPVGGIGPRWGFSLTYQRFEISKQPRQEHPEGGEHLGDIVWGRAQGGESELERQLLASEEHLSLWHKWTLLLAQKVVMLKTYLLAAGNCLNHVFPPTPRVLQSLNMMAFHFLWGNRRSLVRRSVTFLPVTQGRLDMVGFEAFYGSSFLFFSFQWVTELEGRPGQGRMVGQPQSQQPTLWIWLFFFF